MMKYERIGLLETLLSLIRVMLGSMELRLIQLSPQRNSTEKRETNSILIVLLTDSSKS